jgi:hypothetical protein
MSDNPQSQSKTPQQTVLCTIVRAFWTDDGRVNEGTEVSLPIEQAMDLIESGAVIRVKKDK